MARLIRERSPIRRQTYVTDSLRGRAASCRSGHRCTTQGPRRIARKRGAQRRRVRRGEIADTRRSIGDARFGSTPSVEPPAPASPSRELPVVSEDPPVRRVPCDAAVVEQTRQRCLDRARVSRRRKAGATLGPCAAPPSRQTRGPLLTRSHASCKHESEDSSHVVSGGSRRCFAA